MEIQIETRIEQAGKCALAEQNRIKRIRGSFVHLISYL